MSERVERQVDGDDPLVSVVLETVDEPAAVCDPSGRLRGWNEAFAGRLGAVGDLDDAFFGDLVDCPSDPFARAVETGEKTMGTGSVSTSGNAVTAAVRPVERDGSATALVVTVTRRGDPLADDRALYEASVDAAADTVYVVDREYTIRMAGNGFKRATDVPTEEVEGRDIDYLRELGLVDEETFQVGVRSLRRLFAGEAESERIRQEVTLRGRTCLMENHLSIIRRDGEVVAVVNVVHDVTERERQRDELETLTEIQELVQESMRALTGATTAEAIRETVCDRLAESAFYEFAWIGRPEPGERTLEPKYSAGEGEGYLDDVTVRVDASDHGGGPGSEAYRTGEVRVVHDVASDPDFEPWREAALESGFQSVAAVPLTHGSTTHGLLAVYADRPNAFSDPELAGFEVLGEVVGFALSAAQYRRLLEADSVLQLEFEIRGETPLLEASSEHGCRFEIERAVQTGDDRVVSHLTVEGADPVVGEMAARELPNLQQLRRLDGKDGPHYEMAVSDSVFQSLAEAGAHGERGVVEDGVGHMHVEAPADADVRQIVDAVSERFPTVNLVAKREERRTETPWWHTHGDIGAQLTDRQRAVLKTAYFNGYYEWPRETDSEALADSLDIASTTLLQHLRKGHRRVLEAMFES